MVAREESAWPTGHALVSLGDMGCVVSDGFHSVGLIPNTNARQHALQHRCSSTELHLNWELSCSSTELHLNWELSCSSTERSTRTLTHGIRIPTVSEYRQLLLEAELSEPPGSRQILPAVAKN